MMKTGTGVDDFPVDNNLILMVLRYSNISIGINNRNLFAFSTLLSGTRVLLSGSLTLHGTAV